MRQIEQLIWWLNPNQKQVGRYRLFSYFCKMKFRFTDNGEIVETESYKSLVDFMRQNAPFVNAKNNSEYMLGYAQRVVISKDQDIRAYGETEFVEDLLKYNHVEILENNLN